MRDITDLDNFVPPDDDNAFGRLKDTVYSGGSVVEVGSRIFADWIMDLLSIPYFIAAKKGIAINGVADDTADSQAYDLVFGEVTDYQDAKVDPLAAQLALSAWRGRTSSSKGVASPYEFSGAAGYKGEFATVCRAASNALTAVFIDRFGTVTESNISNLATQNRYPMIHDGTKFCTIEYDVFPNTPNFIFSPDGVAWSAVTYDSNSSRQGGRTLEKVGSTLVIPANDLYVNGYYTSIDGGLNWTFNSLATTSPLYKPIVSASSGSDMIWVDEDGEYVRYFDGSTWTDCTLNGDPLSDSGVQQIVYTGNRYVIYDPGVITGMWMSQVGDPTTFDFIPLPRTGEGFRRIQGGNGVLVVDWEPNQVYAATEANAEAGEWYQYTSMPGSSDSGFYSTGSAFDGQQFCFISQNLTAGKSILARVSAPVQF